MRVPYGPTHEFFKHSLFLVFCNRLTTSAVSAVFLLTSKKALDPVAPIYKYGVVSISNILTTTCQYEALKYVSFPVQTLAKCAKMIPVMIWGTLIMQKKYKGPDYFLALLVTLGCSLFILFPGASELSPYRKERESTVWGVSLMIGYLGFDGFTSTFQDKLFKGYDMGIYNQIFYTTLCSCILSLTGLILQGNLLMAIDFVSRHKDCFFDIALLSTVATASQFFISYTIRTFGALTFATIMTTRQLVSILLSCVWFSHPLSVEQFIGAVSTRLYPSLHFSKFYAINILSYIISIIILFVALQFFLQVIVFGSLYAKSYLKRKPETPLPTSHKSDEATVPLKAIA
ncbi:putative UAA transporter [Helianthus annuus]|nr:putative UAA transporter [Helianthus annuus]